MRRTFSGRYPFSCQKALIEDSEDANSKGVEQGGGSKLSQTFLAYAHQNGLVAVADGLSRINRLRRTSNMLSSALRFGTTQHMLPYASQEVPWRTENSPEAFAMNVMALADAESQRTLHAFPDLRRYNYDFKLGQVKDRAGDVFSQKVIAAIVHGIDPGHTNGVGEMTAMRAIITHSARELEKRALLFNQRLDPESHKGLLYSYGAARRK